MRTSEVVSGLCFGLVGLVFCVGAVRLGLGSSTSDGVPGAGFFPFILSICVMVLSFALVVQSLRGPNAPSPFRMDAEQLPNKKTFALTLFGLALLLALWVYPPLNLLDRLGLFESFLFADHAFEAALIIYALFMSRMLKRSWRFAFVFAGVFWLLVYGVFMWFLMIQFDL